MLSDPHGTGRLANDGRHLSDVEIPQHAKQNDLCLVGGELCRQHANGAPRFEIIDRELLGVFYTPEIGSLFERHGWQLATGPPMMVNDAPMRNREHQRAKSRSPAVEPGQLFGKSHPDLGCEVWSSLPGVMAQVAQQSRVQVAIDRLERRLVA